MFSDQIKALSINIPFIYSIAQMSKYTKFLKDLLSTRKKIEQASAVILNEQHSTKLIKMKYPGILIIPCEFWYSTKMNSLADFGASINLTPYSFYKKIDLPELKPTRMDIYMADWSVTYPEGIIEDLL